MTTNDTPIICNGFKDAEFIEMAMLAQTMGRNIIPVVEKYTELQLILEYSKRVGVRPNMPPRPRSPPMICPALGGLGAESAMAPPEPPPAVAAIPAMPPIALMPETVSADSQ